MAANIWNNVVWTDKTNVKVFVLLHNSIIVKLKPKTAQHVMPIVKHGCDLGLFWNCRTWISCSLWLNREPFYVLFYSKEKWKVICPKAKVWSKLGQQQDTEHKAAANLKQSGWKGTILSMWWNGPVKFYSSTQLNPCGGNLRVQWIDKYLETSMKWAEIPPEWFNKL